MPTKEQQRKRLIDLLKELFQLNQPELDFGFYRIMHAKAKEVTRFLEKDLLAIVEQSFGQEGQARLAELKGEYEAALDLATSFGAPDPGETPAVKQAKAALDAAADTARVEAEVYDHLYRFFERYYDDGDFLSRRYLSRETAGKAAPFAIPYNGEEVKLHWANADQYYIKTTEHFTDYTFRLGEEPEAPRVHFKVVEATEGEHGNIKASGEQKRFFILKALDFVALEEGQLVIRFEYRPDPEKTGQDNKWQQTRNTQAEQKVLAAVETMAGAAAFHQRLKATLESGKTVLASNIGKYTARNTMDYFIHKDLGGFLHRELDFYIKNEVMRLDDIESADAPKAEQYLAKIRVLRAIAGKLVDFLAQLEDFQKKLWLKKKFVIETNYCITLDRILAVEDEKTRDWLVAQVIANDAQRKEWVRLFAIDEMKGDMAHAAYAEPLTRKFLEENAWLVLDTGFFGEGFISLMLVSLAAEKADNGCVLVSSENFQGMNLLAARFAHAVNTAYIDPPFNLGETADYLYRVDYKDATWISLLADRLRLAQRLIGRDGSIFVRCNHDGNMLVRLLMTDVYGQENYRNEIIVRRAEETKGDLNRQFEGTKSITVNYDNLYWYSMSPGTRFGRFLKPVSEERGQAHWHSFWKAENRPNMRYEILGIDLRNHYGQWMWERNRATRAVDNYKQYETEQARTGESLEDYWRRTGESLEFVRRTGDGYSSIKYWIPPRTVIMADNNWLDVKGYANKWEFKTENSEPLLKRITESLTKEDDLIMDFFLGSGTTAAVAAKMKRRWIGIEMGEHFDTVAKRRLTLVLAGESSGISKQVDWHGGGAFKYIRLESYEDCLNNLELKDDATRQTLLEQNAGLRQDYMLRYMLDVETRGSQSLLNIDSFADPTAYKLKVKKPASDEYDWRNVDLLETFNWLIGLRVEHIAAPQSFAAAFKREVDPELPKDQNTRLVLDGKMKQDPAGPWWFRKVEGWVPDGSSGRQKVLIVWRKLTGELEKDNAVLDAWFDANRISTQDWEFDTIYVNGSNNLPNLRKEGEDWKVRLIEEDFHKLMWDMEEA